MVKNKEFQLCKHTFGNSPACILLAHVLTQHQLACYKKMHAKHQKLKEFINKINKSNLDNEAVMQIMNMQRELVKNQGKMLRANSLQDITDQQATKIINDAYDIFDNVMLSEVSKKRREANFYITSKERSIQKALSKVRNAKRENERAGTEVKPVPSEVNVSGFTNNGTQRYETTVNVDDSTQTPHTEVIFDAPYQDNITNEKLIERSKKRAQRLGKSYTLY